MTVRHQADSIIFWASQGETYSPAGSIQVNPAVNITALIVKDNV
jgi:hypothetical protein